MTTSDRRLLFSGAAVVAVAATALGGWWLSRPDLPSDWSGRSQFCAEAQTFALVNQSELTSEQRVEAMAALIRSAPRELTPDLERLAGALGGPEPTTPHDHGPTGSSPEAAGHDAGTAAHEHDAASAAEAAVPNGTAVKASGRRAGEFIERTCGVNLPNIRT
ncbi:hypothetical protein [Micromonospora peucetia]|uniref:Uncharacterized protein n=1 Tax=Micromonospora peucetia TaxID=47871 RepID=A0A1C6VTN2_9ACTN|nr:hypothetical protein [Micromonospora peucetia]SCL69686.1 hypothetical protein GA0070608_4092 [Micromonospora peucetia]